jgi:hypothetical protein
MGLFDVEVVPGFPLDVDEDGGLLSLPLLNGCGIGGWVTPAMMPCASSQ